MGLMDNIQALAATNNMDVNTYMSKAYQTKVLPDGTLRSFDPEAYPLPSAEYGDEIANLQEKVFRLLNNELYQSAGFGGFYNQLQTAVAKINRYGPSPLAPNRVFSGYTFITRPQLNLATSSILNNRVLSILDTDDPRDINFMIRGLLDPRWYFRWMFDHNGQESELLDQLNPLFTPLCNCLTSCTGWPDYVLEQDKGDTGFFSEGLTIASGSNRLKQGADLSLTFKEIHGGIILSIFHMWLEYMAAVTKNELVAYPQEIDQRRLNYTVSIYRFIMTPDKRFIQHCAKATGCFPLSVPLGALFNVNQGELHVAAAKEVSIPFVANVVEYDDPVIPYEFNILMKRYWPDIESAEETPGFNPTTSNIVSSRTTNGPEYPYTNPFNTYLRYNYVGLPYIVPRKYKGLEIVFKYIPSKWEQDNVGYGPFERHLDQLILAKAGRYNQKVQQDHLISQELQRLMNDPNGGEMRY
jgi:hypothetical protein